MKNTPFWNQVYPREIIKHLTAHGIEDFCVAPGSRSTPLVLALDESPSIRTHVHYDERGLGFFALGIALAQQKPVAIVVTSGTAVANLMPAVIEAYYSRASLIIMSADRPSELRQCEANQTIYQADLFGKHVYYSFDFPYPSEEMDFGFISTQISQALHATIYHKGPVHLNFMLKEPFFGSYIPSDQQVQHPPLLFSLPRLSADPFAVEALAKQVCKDTEGLIIIGSEFSQRDLLQIDALASHLKFPILPEILSNFHMTGKDFIAHSDLLLKKSIPSSFNPKHVLFFGHRLISKNLMEWLKKLSLKTFSQIAPEVSYYNPMHRLTHKFTCDVASFCETLIHFSPLKEESCFAQNWIELSKAYSEAIENYPVKDVEWQFFRALSQKVAGYPLFIANSMPIRYMNMFYHPEVAYTHVNVNRGTSGIDGNIGTSLGLCKGRNHPLISIMGDQTALHDINSLNLARNIQGHHLIIMNNSGGNIFSHLPIGKYKEPFEKFFFSRHSYDFSPIAEMFSLPYYCIHTLEELSNLKLPSASSLIEIQVSAELSNEDYQNMVLSINAMAAV